MTFDSSRLANAWERYVARGAALHPPFRTYLAAGATADQLAAAERTVGCAFPPDLRFLLALHNGSDAYQVLPGWDLFSTDRLADEWKIWEDLYHEQFKPEGYTCKPDGPIKGDEWWRLKWLPFCGDGGGNHLCLDMDPAPDGLAGQVITMWHDTGERIVVANSLTEFIELIAGDIEAGKLVWNEEWGGINEPQTG